MLLPCVNLQVNLTDMSTFEESLTFAFHQFKNAQDGVEGGEMNQKHCYGNPVKGNEAIDLMLALGIWFSELSTAYGEDHDSTKLFPQKDPAQDFRKWLSAELQSPAGIEICSHHGINVNAISKHLTGHGIRKGAANAVTSGCISGPSIISVCLRAGWSIGQVLSRYFRFEAAGDCFVGRCVSLLDPNTPTFDALPPHFKRSDDLNMDELSQLMKAQYGNFLVEYNEGSLVPVLEICLATLLARKTYLAEKLEGTGHSVLQSAIFNQAGDLGNHIWDEADETMKPTGIPIAVTILKQLEQIGDIRTVIQEETQKALEAHALSQGHLTADYLDSRLAAFENRVLAALSDGSAAGAGARGAPNLQLGDNPPAGGSSLQLPRLSDWNDGRQMPLPKNFVFSKTNNVYDDWLLWNRGASPSFFPYKRIQPKLHIFCDGSPERVKQRHHFSMMKRVMLRIDTLSMDVEEAPSTDVGMFDGLGVYKDYLKRRFHSAYGPGLR